VPNKLTREANATMAALCQVHTEEMVGVLVSIARGIKIAPAARAGSLAKPECTSQSSAKPIQRKWWATKNAPAARAVAAQAVLDRGNGKPLQRSEHSGPDGNPLMSTATIILTGMPDPEELHG
jgi:hypothetical protein